MDQNAIVSFLIEHMTGIMIGFPIGGFFVLFMTLLARRSDEAVYLWFLEELDRRLKK